MKSENIINIAEDFSDAPGARYYKNGPKSGQEFYDTVLKPKFELSVKKNIPLTVNLDGTWGYASSFISESFGRLSQDFGTSTVLNLINLISDEDPAVKNYVITIIKNPEAR